MEQSTTFSRCMSKRRYCTSDENLHLIRSLKLLHAQGWKCDGSFRGGCMGRLQKMMEERFPRCGIENMYSLIVGILGSSSGPGVSWDPNTKMIVTDSDSVHPKATNLRGQLQPLYKGWVEIFGNDRAQGTGAVDVSDALNELLYCLGGTNNDSGQNDAHETPASTPRTVPDDIINDATSISPPSIGTQTSIAEIGSMMRKWMETTSTTLGNLVSNMPSTTTATPASSTFAWDKKALRDAIADMTRLSVDEKERASFRIAHNKDDLELFSVMTDEETYRFVRVLFSGKLQQHL
ncbi:hypothetical protein CDL12_14550 [Handroanthus impetiginosus]|uniref:Myb/SANT-like domain-containing protein n=1 Tax=Handroanthus impetiginosus TaxID=429701 RepID=A0A2G9H5P7_9LAMI|nr:hypothetical protein CDL12_14550 [Handroanthus impetiginosus]